MSVKAKTVQAKQRELRILEGTWRPFVPSQAAREHIVRLRASGMSVRSISALSGLPMATLQPLVWDTAGAARPGIRPETEKAILAVREHDLDRIPGHRHVPAIGVQRRIQALQAMGWTVAWIGEQLGVSGAMISRTCLRTQHVTVRRAREIRDLYDAYALQQGPSQKTARRSATKGWVTALAWDDDTIDDLAAEPVGIGPATASARQQIADLVELGVSVHDIAMRRHTTVEAVERALQRAADKNSQEEAA